MGGGYEFLLPVAPHAGRGVSQGIDGDADERASRVSTGKIHLVPEALPALYHSRAGIVASGTATVEAAIMGTPFVMVYRVSALTYALGKPRVKVPVLCHGQPDCRRKKSFRNWCSTSSRRKTLSRR